jgi:hypothetical protein
MYDPFPLIEHPDQFDPADVCTTHVVPPSVDRYIKSSVGLTSTVVPSELHDTPVNAELTGAMSADQEFPESVDL